jgi:hypothetical protein
MTEFTHKYYGQKLIGQVDTSYQFKKKPWVPDWLWELVSLRDPVKFLEERFNESKKQMETVLSKNVFEKGRG